MISGYLYEIDKTILFFREGSNDHYPSYFEETQSRREFLKYNYSIHCWDATVLRKIQDMFPNTSMVLGQVREFHYLFFNESDIRDILMLMMSDIGDVA